MGKNHLMAMAEFIHSHPEHQMQPPRVWRTHFEDECNQENKAYSFSALKQYPTLVKISSNGRNNLYGSAKLPADSVSFGATLETSAVLDVKSAKVANNKQKTATSVAGAKEKLSTHKQPQTTVNKQLDLRLTPESALSQIERIMQQAADEINLVVRQLKPMTSQTNQVKNSSKQTFK